MARSKRSGRSSPIVRKNVKPERVYRVVPNTPKPVKKTKARKHKFKLSASLSSLWLVIGMVLVLAFGIGLIFAAYSHVNALQTSTKAVRQASEYNQQTTAKMRLIGSRSQFPNEIINYSSAPDDLRPFITKDYYIHKSHCIVNGNYVGPVSYSVASVVYDSFARIEKGCGGSGSYDATILKKMSGTWTVIFTGNDLPVCSDVNAFAIPQGISYNCRQGITTYLNPNP